MNALGRQVLVDFYDCNASVFEDQQGIRAIMLRAVEASGATIVADTFHGFSPHGVSGVVIIAESHVALHTWPEHRYASVDIFSCADSIDTDVIQSMLADAFEAGRTTATALARGVLDPS